MYVMYVKNRYIGTLPACVGVAIVCCALVNSIVSVSTRHIIKKYKAEKHSF